MLNKRYLAIVALDIPVASFSALHKLLYKNAIQKLDIHYTCKHLFTEYFLHKMLQGHEI